MTKSFETRTKEPRATARARAALLALALFGCAATAAAQGPADARAQGATPARADATVILCSESGEIAVRGSERAEVRASASSPATVRLRPTRAGGDAQAAASSVEVFASDGEDGPACHFSGRLTVEVPRGSFVQIKTVQGRVSVAGVAGVRVETVSGDVDLRDVARSAEVASANGGITLRRAAGRVRLHTISGMIEAAEIAPGEAGDDFSAKTTSGAITLARVAHTRVEVSTTSGQVEFAGALAPSGVYSFRSHSGGVTLTLPADSSFRLNARVSHGGEIMTDFLVRVAQEASGDNLLGGSHTTLRLNGVAGTAEQPSASVALTSFSGTLTLRKAGSGAR